MRHTLLASFDLILILALTIILFDVAWHSEGGIVS
jgi:hypothetical protein